MITSIPLETIEQQLLRQLSSFFLSERRRYRINKIQNEKSNFSL